jgi:hypothetical protein
MDKVNGRKIDLNFRDQRKREEEKKEEETECEYCLEKGISSPAECLFKGKQ